MQKICALAATILISLGVVSQSSVPATDLLNQPVDGFELHAQTLIDGLAKIHAIREPSFSVEFYLKKEIGDPPLGDHLISGRIKAGTLRSVLDQLIALDGGHAWSIYKHTVNVYPQSAAIAGNNYFLNRKVLKFEFTSVTDPSQLILQTASSLPGPLEQIAWRGAGSLGRFESPWTDSFTNLSVREIFDEIAEHLCGGCGWTLTGAKNFRIVQFHGQLSASDSGQAPLPGRVAHP
jgi:hypothetical protein